MKIRTSFLIAPLLLLASPLQAANVWTSGHGDVFAVGWEGGALEPHAHLEGGIVNGVAQNDVEFEADDIVVAVPLNTAVIRPVGADWDPTGVVAGAPFYRLPQSGTTADSLGVPFAGIASEELIGESGGPWTNITFKLISVTGPGAFSLWQDGLAPEFFMSSEAGFDNSTGFVMGTLGHDHANFGFTALGDYDVTIEMSGMRNGVAVAPAQATYTFAVGIPEPSTGVLGLLGGCSLILSRRRRATGQG